MEKKANNIYRIFRKMSLGSVTPEQRQKLNRWIISPLDTEEKEEAFSLYGKSPAIAVWIFLSH